MSITGRIEALWSAKFWDAMGCGYCEAEAERAANAATATLCALLKSVERAQQPRLPRFSNLAGRRQHTLANSGRRQ